jgi:phage tail-like protein
VARSVDSDPLQNFNFYLLDVPVLALIPLAFPFKTAQAATDTKLLSFKRISLPTATLATKEIQEGNWPFKHVVTTGFVSTSEVTIESAVTPLSLDFYIWFHQAVYGVIAPRRNFTVVQTRQDKLIPRRVVVLEGCLPISWKPSSDFDATSSDVSIETLTMSCHRVEVLPGIPL